MSEYVLDASALLAMLQGEPGSTLVLRHAAASWISAVNMAEAYGKLIARGVPGEYAMEMAFGAVKGVMAFNDGQARLTAGLLQQTRALGLSLGDRACLALALERKPACTHGGQGLESAPRGRGDPGDPMSAASARRNRWLVLAGFVLACEAVGGVSGWLTAPAITGWYRTLAKPLFNPPDAVFGRCGRRCLH